MLESNPFEGEFDPEVVEYDENGEAITSFGAPDPAHSFLGLERPPGVAVTAGDEQIYVANSREYGGVEARRNLRADRPGRRSPRKTEPPELTPTKVTLKGTVDLDGGGDATNCYFEWGSSGTTATAPCTPASPISGRRGRTP